MDQQKMIQHRMPVWQALSGLFFISEEELASEIKNIIKPCKASQLTLSVLRNIYFYELMPALFAYTSGWSAFDGAGFSDAWLKEAILRYCNNVLVGESYKPTLAKKWKKLLLPKSIKKYWRFLEAALRADGVT